MADVEAPAKAIQVKLVLLGEAAVGKSSLVLRFVQNDFNENNSPTIGAAFLTQKCRLEDKVIKFEIWDTAGQERFHSLAPMYYRNAAAAVVVYDITKAASLEKAKAWVTELQRQANPSIVIALVGNKLDLITDSFTTPTSPFSSTSTSIAKSTSSSAPAPDDPASAPESGALPDDEDTAAAAAADTEDEETPQEEPVSAPKTGPTREVEKEDAVAYAREAGGLLFFEASAKTGKGVQDIFTEIAKKLPMESMMPKTGSAGAAGSANARRAAGSPANATAGGTVKLGDGATTKKAGGCC